MNDNTDKIDLLLKYINKDMPPNEVKRVERLIKSNAELAELYSTILALKKEGGRTNWPNLKKSISTLSLQMFDDFQELRKPRPKISGIRVFDSKAMPLPDGVRPAVVDCRRLKFKIDDLFLEISMYPISANAYEIIGQLSGYEKTGNLIFTLSSGKKKIMANGDKFNLFRFAKVPINDYILSIHFQNKKIGAVGLDL